MAINKALINEYILDGFFGLEKESLRVDEQGFLSKVPHPFADMVQVDRDFCESQVELITDVHDTLDGMYEELTQLHNYVVEQLYNLDSGREYIWNNSNPPHITSDEDINIAQYSGHLYGKQMYREYLSKKYGKKKMLYSGIHFNFSFTEEYLQEAFKNSGQKNYRKFKDKLYLDLSEKTLELGWLVVYLTAASPVIDSSFLEEQPGDDVVGPYASRRCSEVGYWNDFVPVLDYKNLSLYVDSVKEYVDCGKLQTATELYYPVRLKPPGANTLDRLKSEGVDHIELRNIDLNPLSEVGIMKEDLEFIHLFLIYLTLLDKDECNNLVQMTAIKNIKEAAKLDDRELLIETGWGEERNIRELALDVLDQIKETFEPIDNANADAIIEFQKNKLLTENGRYAQKVIDLFGHNYVTSELHECERIARKVTQRG